MSEFFVRMWEILWRKNGEGLKKSYVKGKDKREAEFNFLQDFPEASNIISVKEIASNKLEDKD